MIRLLKKISSKEVYKNRWIRVTEDKVKTIKGKQFIYGVVRKKPFALIIPWDGKKFTLVGQYRYIVNSFSWEFPQGHYEHKSITKTAKTELEEETGYIAGKIKKIGSFWIGPGAINQECVVFLAINLKKGKMMREESEQDMKIKKVSSNKIHKMIESGIIKDGPTIAALSLLEWKKY